jgi:Flp pilus assembly protein TadD
LDEDDLPILAGVLAALTDPVPVGTVERPLARAGRVAWRAGVLVALVLLTYLPTLLASNLLDGEGDAYAHQPAPPLTWSQIWRLPATLVQQPPPGPPPVLRVFLRYESILTSGVLTHHLSGLILHAAVTVVLWLILRRLNRPGAWLAAGLFAVNPGSAAAVDWIASRGRPWGGLLALTGCWLILRAVGVPPRVNIDAADFDPDEQVRDWGYWVGLAVDPLLAVVGVLALLTGALCQPTAAVVGLIAIVLVAWRRGLRAWDLLWTVPVLVLAGASAVAAVRIPLPSDRDAVVRSLPGFLQFFWYAGRAVERMAWPLSAADLASAGTHSQALTTCGIGAGLVLVTGVLVLLRNRLGRGVAVAAACTVLLLPTVVAPMAVRPIPGLTAARQADAAATYLVVIPVLALLADVIVGSAQRVRNDLTRRATELAVAAVVLWAVAIVGMVRAHAYVDTETILRTAVRVNHRAWDQRSRLAGWYIAQKRPDQAFDALSGLTLANCPDAAVAMTQGDLLSADGNLTDAMAWYNRAGQLDPADPGPVGRQSSTLVAMGRVGDAVDNYEAAIKLHPGSAELHAGFGELMASPALASADQHNLQFAEDQFRRAIAIDPDVADWHVALATVLADQYQPNSSDDAKLIGAAKELQEAVRLDPENYNAFHNDGVILLRIGAAEQSAHMLVEAVRLRPDSATARSDLAVALIRIKKFKAAKFELTEALKLQPDFPPAVSNMKVLDRLMAAEQRRASVEGK